MAASNPQVKAALEKRDHPERYCRHPRCLWKIVKGDGTPDPCRRHPVPMEKAP